jgi:hypothetical protein
MKLIQINRHFFRIKGEPSAVYFCTQAHTDISLNVRSIEYIKAYKDCTLPDDWTTIATRTIAGDDLKKVEPMPEGLGMAYRPASRIHKLPNSSVPDSMADDMHKALQKLIKATGGDVTDFVCERLQWSRDEIEDYLLAEQVDSVALAIYNMEVRHQAIIIGDQTGVGKGRMAASLIRYGIVHKLLPVFITEKANLFSDIYRDLKDIGCEKLKPFTFNTTSDANITERNDDGDDVIIYRHASSAEQKDIFEAGKLPNKYDFVLATYSQFQGKDTTKATFMEKIVDGALLILDEAHNASGSGGKDRSGEFKGTNTYQRLSNFADKANSLCFLSATFAKRPDNMPLYAQHTCMTDAGLSNGELITSIAKGGEALQEVLSAMLVREGQLVRRENSYDGVEVNYIYLDKTGERDFGVPDYEQSHYALCNNVTALMRDIIAFENRYIIPLIGAMDFNAMGQGEEIKKTEKEMGVGHAPYFSKVFQTVNQILFSIKAQAVADHAIRRLKEGKKVVIALANTIEATLKELHEDTYGERSDNKASEGSVISTDYSYALLRGLDTCFRYQTKDEAGKSQGVDTIDPKELPEDGYYAYLDLVEKIKHTTTGISCSPIDLIIQRIEKAGFRCAEVTGRKLCVDFVNEQGTQGILRSRKKIKKQIAFSQFQNNELDVLLINSSGSTGASAHATTKGTNLRPDQVKPRCMIIAQCELNVSTEVQKRGRINRTGQIATIPPSYDYLISAIPAEKRMMMMLQKKLRSLDANTTSKQKQSTNIIDLNDTDFINKYGDMVAIDFLQEYPDINDALDDPCNLNGDGDVKQADAAKKVSGRIALLDTTDQDVFYKYMVENYVHLIEKLKQSGEYDLEVTDMPLNARLIKKEPCTDAPEGGHKSVFSDPAYLCQYECDVLRKPMSITEITADIRAFVGDNEMSTAKSLAKQMADNYVAYYRERYEARIAEINDAEKRELELMHDSPKNRKLVEDQKKTWEDIEEEIKTRFKAKRTKADADFTEQKRVRNFIEFFYAGRACICGKGSDVKSICLGVRYKSKSAENIHRPSNLAVRFATSDSLRLLEYTLSKNDEEDMSAIYTKSSTLSTGSYNREADERYLNKSFIDDWQDMCAGSQANRRVRYIITGNMLKGYAKALKDNPDRPVVLVNFTLQDGGTEKGILFPDDFNPAKNGNLQRQFTRSPKQMRHYLLDNLSMLEENGGHISFRISTPAGTCGMEIIGNPKSEEAWKKSVYITINTPARKAADKDFASDPRWVDISRWGRGFENAKYGYPQPCLEFKSELRYKFEGYPIEENYRNLMGKILDILSDVHTHSGKPFKTMFVFTAEEVQRYFGENTEIAESNADAAWKPAPFDPSNIPASKKPASSNAEVRLRIAKAKIKIAKAKIAIAEAEN